MEIKWIYNYIYNNVYARVRVCTWMLCIAAILTTGLHASPVGPAVAAQRASFLDDYNVSLLTMRQGLRHNFVDDIYVDSKGFVWLAMSGGGLSRFDGYEFADFSPNFDDFHVKSNFVMKVCEDPFGRLWVASEGGIDVIDVVKLSPAMPLDNAGGFYELLDSNTWCVEADSEGCIWLSSVKGIVRLHFDDEGGVDQIAMFDPPYNTDNRLIIKDVYRDGTVWASIDGVIMSLSVDEDGHMTGLPVSDHLRFTPSTYVSDYIRQGGDVWIGTDAGLWRYNRSENMVKSYRHDPNDPNSLSQNFVTSLAVTSDRRLLVGSLRGLNVYNPIRDDFMRIENRQHGLSGRGLNRHFINCIYVENDRIWVGTEGGGVTKYVPNHLAVRAFCHEPGNPSSLSDNPVNAIYQDSKGTVWIGTVEGGLNRTDENFSRFEHFTHENGVLSHNSVSTITDDNRGRLWVGTWGGGVDILDRDNPRRRISHIENSPVGNLRMPYVSMLVCDTLNNVMWIGCGRGLYVCDLSTMSLSEPFEGAATGVAGCVAGAIDGFNHLWVGGTSGLYDIDLKSRKVNGTFAYRNLRYKLDNPYDRSTEKVASLYVTPDNVLWIGSNGNGVYRRDVDDAGREEFVNFNKADGLSNDIVLGVLTDRTGGMWAGTYNGLSYRLPGGAMMTYGTSDGLPSGQFYWNSSCRMNNGNLAFGTTGGLAVIYSDAVRVSREPFKVRFTRLSVDGEDMHPGNGTEIHESIKSVGLEFTALDYDSGGRGAYYYCLSGFEKGWFQLPSPQHRVTYTNLSPGKYVFKIKYLSPGVSFESAPMSEYPIKVNPYFYRRWWFISIVVMLLMVSVMLFHRWRVRDLTRQKIELQRSVNERTWEISKQKRLLEQRAVELSEQNNQLKLSNEEILSQKTQLAEMARRVQELSVDRISFFTNITHEFRTPITLIIGPIQRAIKLSYNPQVVEQLKMVERNSKYLLSLVNQLMDFRKVESGKMEIVRTRGNFRRFITDTVDSFRMMASDRRIDLKLMCRLSGDMFSYDEEALRKVLINLIGNAVKFTPDGGRVKVYAALVPTAKCGSDMSLYINVSDSGNGLRDVDIEHVFDRFYQGSSQLKYPVTGSSGSGIGLFLCKSLVEIYGGHIWARNNAGGVGCSFRLLLPVDDVGSASDDVPTGPAAPSDDADNGHSSVAVSDDGRITILIVEDNDDMRVFIRSILSDYYNVVEASNGEEALRILMSRNIDFIVSDLMMPVMDGLELSRRVKEDFAISHIPFLMLTAKTSPDTRLESFRVGVDEYLQKPFDEHLLLTRIRNILDNQRRHTRTFGNDMRVSSLNIDEESRDKKFMDQAMKVIKVNYKNSYFEVGDFAEALGVSRTLLNKKLQSLVGMSAGQLIRTYRMNLAREMIIQNRRTHAKNIAEISYEVGFNDSKYFTRCFTKHFGVTPSAFMSDS